MILHNQEVGGPSPTIIIGIIATGLIFNPKTVMSFLQVDLSRAGSTWILGICMTIPKKSIFLPIHNQTRIQKAIPNITSVHSMISDFDILTVGEVKINFQTWIPTPGAVPIETESIV